MTDVTTLTENRQMHGTEHLIGLLDEDNGHDEPVEVVYSYDDLSRVVAHVVIYRDHDGDYVWRLDDPDADTRVHATSADAVAAAVVALGGVTR